MKRIFCLIAFLAILASDLAGEAQQKEPPKDFTNSIGMKFVWIPPGTFLMGSPKEVFRRNQDEIQHKVTLTKGFYMGVYAVTQEEWQAVMGNNPSYYRGEKNMPVELVAWTDCQIFLEKMGKKESRSYRLPTEAEWEFSCRAGTTSPFSCGDNITSDSQANFNGNYPYRKGIGSARNKTTFVGNFPANPWGLYDMHGNVMQWCADLYEEYPQDAVTDPHSPEYVSRISTLIIQLSSQKFTERQAATKALTAIGLHALPAFRKTMESGPDLETQRRIGQIVATISEKEERRVLRGGSFNSPASHLRSAHRFKYGPNERFFFVGFRVALTIASE